MTVAMPRDKISEKDIKILITKARGTCSFPGCCKQLVGSSTSPDNDVFLGKMAHIIADSRQGPRGDSGLTSEERKKHTNLILLCQEHHDIVDQQIHTYSVPVLRQMKRDHEERTQLSYNETEQVRTTSVSETVFCSMLPVSRFPSRVFISDCKYRLDTWEKVVKQITYPSKPTDEVFPFLLRDRKIYAFHDLRKSGGPFASVIGRNKVDELSVDSLWLSADTRRIFVQLLNKGLTSFLRKKGILFQKEHHRYFFKTFEPGVARKVTYRPLNASSRKRLVVWNPKIKATGEFRDYWVHLSANLSFRYVGNHQWVFCVRPEYYLTQDSVAPLGGTLDETKKIGKIVTKRKSLMRNSNYLNELNFWVSVLSSGMSHICISFGDQAVFIESRLSHVSIEWPGIPNDAIQYKNTHFDEDLFSYAEKKDFFFNFNETDESE